MSYTTIQHAIRIKLDISPNEYMILDMVYRMATSPKARVAGWCYSSKNYISKIIGIHESNVFRTINRLIEKGLLIRGEENALLRTSDKWNDLQMNPEDHNGVLPKHTRNSQKDNGVLQEEGMAFRNDTYGVLPYNKYIDNYINDNNIDSREIKDFITQIFSLLNDDLGLDDVIKLLKEKEKEKVAPKRKRFVKPSVEEIKQYCDEQKNDVDANKFFNFYESKGWMIGRNKMKDWKASVRTWENNDKKSQNNKHKMQGPNAVKNPNTEFDY